MGEFVAMVPQYPTSPRGNVFFMGNFCVRAKKLYPTLYFCASG